ncbi:GNAT family N-acetyltransferase [Aquibacillus rhizosphaerae]|uniref:GNAT family N-acetyltransferase n=1 Tax=Aquibacillus rhizosphaerae TaxID=3051431 RepID=A0ABT7L904_9BACI|nr:GNAT family N-acetyltransferase [Aquibacillus sp. LR5S19]MDL4842349.1 GNAT family N-acetyltransferase [Aquibacillus sp. LR5S19]
MIIKRAKVENYRAITELFEELIKEISEKTSKPSKLPPISQTLELCKYYLESETYIVFVAEVDDQIVGFLSLCSSYSLYAGGEFGVIQEFFVSPAHRSKKIGSKLLVEAIQSGEKFGWKRIEVATPPLPQFNQSFMFYRNNSFEDGEGRKMKFIIE